MNPGFYKFDGEKLLYALAYVLNKNYRLLANTHEQYTYPCDGWVWYDDEDTAYLENGVKKPEEIDEQPAYTESLSVGMDT